MKEAIRDRARELGFDDCRFTTASTPESAEHFRNWLAEGRQGEMAYLLRNAHKRIDPQKVLPGAQSVIALAVSYGKEGGVTSHRSDKVPCFSVGQNAGTSDQQPLTPALSPRGGERKNSRPSDCGAGSFENSKGKF